MIYFRFDAQPPQVFPIHCKQPSVLFNVLVFYLPEELRLMLLFILNDGLSSLAYGHYKIPIKTDQDRSIGLTS